MTSPVLDATTRHAIEAAAGELKRTFYQTSNDIVAGVRTTMQKLAQLPCTPNEFNARLQAMCRETAIYTLENYNNYTAIQKKEQKSDADLIELRVRCDKLEKKLSSGGGGGEIEGLARQLEDANNEIEELHQQRARKWKDDAATSSTESTSTELAFLRRQSAQVSNLSSAVEVEKFLKTLIPQNDKTKKAMLAINRGRIVATQVPKLVVMFQKYNATRIDAENAMKQIRASPIEEEHVTKAFLQLTEQCDKVLATAQRADDAKQRARETDKINAEFDAMDQGTKPTTVAIQNTNEYKTAVAKEVERLKREYDDKAKVLQQKVVTLTKELDESSLQTAESSHAVQKKCDAKINQVAKSAQDEVASHLKNIRNKYMKTIKETWETARSKNMTIYAMEYAKCQDRVTEQQKAETMPLIETLRAEFDNDAKQTSLDVIDSIAKIAEAALSTATAKPATTTANHKRSAETAGITASNASKKSRAYETI